MTPGTRLALISAGAVVGCYWAYRAVQNRRIDNMVAGVERLQLDAMRNPSVSATTEGIPTPPEPLPPDSCFQKLANFDFAYIIQRRNDGDFIHHVIGRRAGGSAAQLSEAMLAVMGRLVRQFGSAGLEHEIMLHVECHPAGTQHIDFMMTSDQYSALAQMVAPLDVFAKLVGGQ